MKRIRIDFANRSKRNGYRLVVSKVDTSQVDSSQGFSIFHAIHLDDKLLNEESPNDHKIKSFKEILSKCESKYGPVILNQIIDELK